MWIKTMRLMMIRDDHSRVIIDLESPANAFKGNGADSTRVPPSDGFRANLTA